MTDRPIIISMSITGRTQQRYDHRLRNLVQRTGDVTVATDLGVPRSTARGWLDETPTVVVGLDVTELTEPELRQRLGIGSDSLRGLPGPQYSQRDRRIVSNPPEILDL